jgi:tRNA(Ile)-lysidine synthase
MLTGFEKSVAEFIDANGLFRPSGGILVAVSGGADSTALMYVLRSLKTAGVLNADLTLAHVNHQLRGRLADEDEAFVVEQACILDLPVLTRRIAVADFAAEQKLSIETAARNLRMDALAAMAKESNCSYIAAAHHKDDNAETIMHRLLRGTAWRGLAGIWPAKKFPNGVVFVRPFLCVRREQITSYLEEFKIPWRHDHTNDEQAFTRNFIRHSLLPAIQSQTGESLIELFDRLSSGCRRYVDLLDKKVDGLWPNLVIKKEHGQIELDQKVFASAPDCLKAEIIRRALLAVGSGERDFTLEHYERLRRFAGINRHNKSLTLPAGFVIHCGQTLIFEKPCNEKCARPALSWTIEMQILDAAACDIQSFKTYKTKYVEWFDADKIVGTPAVRPRKDGDAFWPMGLKASKKIGKFLTDAHVQSALRKSICVVEDNEKIIWLAPLRASEETKVTPATKRIMQITCSPQQALTP